MRGLLITGTDTAVGKTFVTAWLARRLLAQGLRVGIYKPACSGAEFRADGEPYWDDVEQHWEALQGRYPRELICPLRFVAPVAPVVAAEMEGVELSLDQLLAGVQPWREQVDLLLVEGAGGWLAPLTHAASVRDLAVELQFPVLIVARQQLGTINHTLLTLESIQQAGLPVQGIVLNQILQHPDPSALTNASLIARGAPTIPIWDFPFQPEPQLQSEPAFGSMQNLVRAFLSS
jgi:dethiobiotin synthetase